VLVQAISEHVPDRAVLAGYESTAAGAVQNLGSVQQFQFMGGVGTDNKASVTLYYESLVEGWVVFTVQVSIGGYMWYGPQEHAVYIRKNGTVSMDYPPRIENFSPGSQLSEQVSFNADISGNPPPEYTLDCGGAGATARLETLICSYREVGYYTATLTATNNVEGEQYSTIATAGVLVPSNFVYLPVTLRGR
jgi:PKD repeat protein